jgi:hypothetical protein
MAGLLNDADGGFATQLQRYLAADSVQAVEAELESLAAAHRVLFERWFDTVLPALADATSRLLASARESPMRTGLPREALDLEVHRWNALGTWAGSTGAAVPARTLYESLLQVLRHAQRDWGRISKVTAYHQLGWVRLVADPPDRAGARAYFMLAVAEEAISGLDPSFDRPAPQALRQVYGVDQAALTNWMSLVREATRREGDEQFAQLVEQNPELLLLDVPTITPESGGPVE